MVIKALNKLLSLFTEKNDRFLVLEILDNLNRAAFIKVNFLDKKIRVLKIISEPILEKLARRIGRARKHKLILTLDSHFATTVYSSVVLVRENYKELIDEAELDNLISQAIWKYFDRQRNKIAAKMGVSDLDIVLTDVKVRGVKLDGHKVVNPAGFKAKTMEVQFSQTFLLRDFINKIKNILPLSQAVLITEHGTAWSSVVARSHRLTNFLTAGLFPEKSLLFLADGSQHAYWNKFSWGITNVHQSLATDLAIEPEIAELILTKYIANDTSDSFHRRFEGLLSKELEVLAHGLNIAAKKSEVKTIYVNSFFDLPNIFTPSFKNRFEHSIELKPLTAELIGQNFDFDIKFKNYEDSRYSFGLLAGLIEWYMSPQDDKMSQLAKRRVRWLSPV